MSPTKKASAVSGLRRGVGAVPAEVDAAAFIEGSTPEQPSGTQRRRGEDGI